MTDMDSIFNNSKSNKVNVQRQAPVIIKYRIDRSRAYGGVGSGIWGDTLQVGAMSDANGARQGDLVFTTKTICENGSMEGIAGASAQAYPDVDARTCLNGVPQDEDVVFLGVSPFHYSGTTTTMADCQIGGTVQSWNWDSENVQPGDLIVWDFPDDDKVRRQEDWGYRRGSADSRNRLTLVNKTYRKALTNWFTVDSLTQTQLINHVGLRNLADQNNVADKINAVMRAMGGISDADKRELLSKLFASLATLYSASKEKVIGRAVTAAGPQQDYELLLAMCS